MHKDYEDGYGNRRERIDHHLLLPHEIVGALHSYQWRLFMKIFVCDNPDELLMNCLSIKYISGSEERLLYWQETSRAFPDWFNAHPVLSESRLSYSNLHIDRDFSQRTQRRTSATVSQCDFMGMERKATASGHA